jgi:Ca2+-binding EF-hand superfamily protein
MSNVVDVILRDSDANKDGFIDYAEFKQTENN